jgi:putative metallohydrolase (TIGR04338 family)
VKTDQAQAVYAAEDLWEAREFKAKIRFGDWHEIQPFYVKLAAAFRENGHDIYPPTVQPRRGALKAHYSAVDRAVFIPPYDRGGVWALTAATAIHEFAHHLSPGTGHGPEFRSAMIQCLSILGWDAERLEQCYAEAGLTTSSKRDNVLDLVSKMLNQAEGAGTKEEKIAFMAGAERLATKHSLDLALLRKRKADADKAPGDRPTTGKLYSLEALPNTTYRNLAVELGTAISYANGARCTIRGKSQWMTFYGFPEDIHLTELMFARITPMMFEASDAYLKSPEHAASGVASVSARITFCKSFAGEIGRRLTEAVEEAAKETVIEPSPTVGEKPVSGELILREKALEVRDYIEHEFKKMGVRGSWSGSKTSNWSSRASSAGRTSARNANIYGRKELTS